MDTIPELARLLEAARLPASRNTISTDELRRWVTEYLAEYDEELAQFPELVGKTHWNLWMVDMSLPDALFAVLVFHPSQLEFICGTGDSFEIREFTEHEVFDDPDAMLSATKQKFRVPEPSSIIDRVSAQQWLGRSW